MQYKFSCCKDFPQSHLISRKMSIASNFIKKYFLQTCILKCNPTRFLNPIVAFISADTGAVPGVPAITAAPPVCNSGGAPLELPHITNYFLEFDRIPMEKPSGPPPRPKPGPEFPRPPSPSPPTPEGPRPPMPSPPERGPTPPDIPPSYI